jgi:hypothetical protein
MQVLVNLILFKMSSLSYLTIPSNRYYKKLVTTLLSNIHKKKSRTCKCHQNNNLKLCGKVLVFFDNYHFIDQATILQEGPSKRPKYKRSSLD